MHKTDLRRKFLLARRALSHFHRRAFSARIQQRVMSHPAWKQAHALGTYLSLPDEVVTHTLVQQAWSLGKQLAAPVVNQAKNIMRFHRIDHQTPLQPGALGILEPRDSQTVSAEDLDLLLIPGVGFDESGFRLGFGRGYFDRFLQSCKAFRMGLAYEAQLTPALPASTWDVPMDCIVTEKRIIPLRANSGA